VTLEFSDAVIANRLKAMTDAIDSASTAGYLNIYDGTRPSAKGDAVTTQVKLAAIRFAKPSAGPVSGTTLTLQMGSPVLALKTGVASWARITNGDGVFVADLDIGPEESGADVEMRDAQLYEGGEVSAAVASLVEA